MSPTLPRWALGCCGSRGDPWGGGGGYTSPRPSHPSGLARPMWGWSQDSPGPAQGHRAGVDPAAPPTPGCPGHPQPGLVGPPVPPATVTSGCAGRVSVLLLLSVPPLPSRFLAVVWGVLCSVSLRPRGAGGPPNPPPHCSDPRLCSGGLWPGFVSPRRVWGWRRGGHLGCADGAGAQPPIPQTFVWQCCGSWQGPLPLYCPPQCPPYFHCPPVPLPEASSPPSCRGSSRGAAAAG